MHGHVNKRVKMYRKPTSGTNRHGKHSSARSEKGKGTHGATLHLEMLPKWLHPNKASWPSDVTKQDQARGGRQAWQSLGQERLAQA